MKKAFMFCAALSLAACQTQPGNESLQGQAAEPAAAKPESGSKVQAASPEHTDGVEDNGYIESFVAPTDHDHHSEVHWMTLPSFDALLPHADVVIRGHVVSYRPDVLRKYDVRDRSVYADSPITISTIMVDDIIQTKAKVTSVGEGAVTLGSTIEIQDLGGLMSDGCVAYPEGKPLLKKGEDVVLFATVSGTVMGLKPGNGGRYSVVGGIQGRFTVTDGVVHALPAALGTNIGFERQEGRPVEEFIAELKASVRPETDVEAPSGATSP
jgi:hypothetical protein